ncbi:class I tRNA ligase family protein, partial [Nonomuraea sp. NPDC055795]
MTTPELPTQYTPADVETRSYSRWESEGYFHADPGSSREPYSIVLPPPNVTGVLHIGHALGYPISPRDDPTRLVGVV